ERACAASAELVNAAEFRHDAAAKPEDAHVQAVDVVLGLDLLGEPAAGLRAAEGARHDVNLQPGLVVNLLVKLHAVAALEPVEIALAVGAEGEAGEQRRGGQLGRPEACRGEAGVDVT